MHMKMSFEPVELCTVTYEAFPEINVIHDDYIDEKDGGHQSLSNNFHSDRNHLEDTNNFSQSRSPSQNSQKSFEPKSTEHIPKFFYHMAEDETKRVRSFTNLQRQNHYEEKSRKISTPELKRARRSSLESGDMVKAERIRTLREQRFSLSNKLIHLTTNGDSMFNLHDDNEGPIKNRSSKTQKFMNSFRRKSFSRTKSPLAKDEKVESERIYREKKNDSNRINHSTNDFLAACHERDRVIDEWSKTATQCEELIDELESTLTELMMIKSECYEKDNEIQGLISRYENDRDERDKEINWIYEQLQETRQQLDVAKTERMEAYEQRDHILQESYICSQKLKSSEEENSCLRQRLLSYEQQMTYMKNDHDHSLRLRKNSEEERKQQHEGEECISRYDSGFSTIQKIVKTSIEDDEYEEIAIGIDTLDSRLGLKLDDAFDEPYVMVVFVTNQLQQKWNIRKYDRITSVNGLSVSRADKRTVEKMIKDTMGRTISLVLRREKHTLTSKFETNIDVIIPKQPDLGLKFVLQIYDLKDQSVGIKKLKDGDIISKINSQNVSEIISVLLKKISKRTNQKLTLRIKRLTGFTDDDINAINNDITPPTKEKSILNILSVRKRSLSELPSPKSILNDISSLFSTEPKASSSSPTMNAPTKERRHSEGYNLKKQIIPDVKVTHTLAIPKLSSSPGTRPKSLALLRNTVHVSTAIFQDKSNHGDILTRNKPNLSPRPSPKLLRSTSTVDKRTQRRQMSHCLTVDSFIDLNFSHSSTTDFGIDSNDDSSIFNLQHSLPGYATLPRRYQRKRNTNEIATTRVLRMEKSIDDVIGFSICGGNRTGIFIKEILSGSEAELSGMKVGDRIVKLNSTDLSRATLDFATRILLNHRSSSHFRIEVKFYPNFEELLSKKPYESLYVRCLMPYTASKNNELSFQVGDILHVTDTLRHFNKQTLMWWWYGTSVEKSQSRSAGILPRIEEYFEEMKRPSPLHSLTSLDNATEGKANKRLRRMNKSAQEFKKWLVKNSGALMNPISIRKREHRWNETNIRDGHKISSDDIRRKVYYEVLLQEPVSI